MKALPRLRLLPLLAVGFLVFSTPVAGHAAPKQQSYWQVDDIRPGMKGFGKTVIKGVRIDTFDAEVLGVLKNTSPGRDLILARLSGCNLEKTGVIAGMSGSPVFIQNKLVGAVAYAWAFGKEPIAGITPFSQMHSFVEAYEKRDLAEEQKPSRIGLAAPLKIDGKQFDTVTVGQDYNDPQPTAADGLWLTPLRTPLAATGMSPGSLSLLGQKLRTFGLVPMQGGGIGASVDGDDKEIPLQAGGALCTSLIQGDFELSAIGTVTHIEGKRVYGFGHPMFGIGACEFPLQTGYVHTIYPRQSLSFKMGSPMKTVGVINADVSTCIAGWLDRQPDLLPIRTTVSRTPGGPPKTFNVKVVRQRPMLSALVFTSLANAVDMEGDLPEELTATLKVRIEVDGRTALVLEDTFSGGGLTANRAPQGLYGQVSGLVTQMLYNNFKPVRITRIDCVTDIQAGRKTADIEATELESDTYAPGDTLKAVVFVRPYKGLRERVAVSLALPKDLPEGTYTASIGDDLTNARAELRDNPTLSNPQNIEQLFQALNVQTAARRTNLVVRVPIGSTGVALGGKALPNLPPSMVQILGNSRKTGAQAVSSALVARHATDWVIQGGDSVRFTVTKNKKGS
jgi:hypothetical protein